MTSVEILDGETHVNITASDRNRNDLTILESEYWSADESSEPGLETSEDDSQKYLVQTGNLSSEEQILDSVFQVCDVEERGMVPAFQIIDYLKSVTDPSRDGKRLQYLSNMLNPDGRSTFVDLPTFRKAMSKWIESCWIDRDVNDTTEDEIFVKDLQPSTEIQGITQVDEYGGHLNRYMREHTELSVKIAELNCTNKKLTDEKTKLQRSLDLAEETNTLLTEEITDLKMKLKSSQQAMQHARSIWNELEDTKMFVKSLEDKISVVITEKKQMEKEERLLSSHKQTLQEENDKLISEKEKVIEKLDSLRVENSKLLHQLYEYESLLAQKDELVTQKTIQTEELMGLVEEQKTLLQELKNEKNNLQEELAQTHEDIAIHSSLSHEQCPSSRSVWSMYNEIEEIQESNSDPKFALPDPLCHILECSLGVETIEKDTRTDTELEEQSTILLKGLSCVSHLKCAWETYASKLKGAKQINTNNKRTRQEQRVQDAISAAACITGLFSEEGCSLAPFIPKMGSYFSTLRLFLVILLYTLIFSIWSGENIWTAVSTTLWPHLKLQHLKLPPI